MRYAAIIAFLLLVGLLFNLQLLMYCGYALAAIFLLTKWLTFKWITVVEVERQISRTEVEIGESIDVVVKIRNPSKFWIPWLLIEDIVPRSALFGPPPSITLTGGRLLLTSLRSNSDRLLRYTITPKRRGYFQLGPTVIETGDFLGLYRRFRVVTDPAYVLVRPRVIPLLGYDVASRRPVGEVRVTYRLMEDPTLISGIRQYEMGDAMSRIHWGATARTGVLHSKVFQPTTVIGATIVLDMHIASNPDRHEPTRTDLAIDCAASICNALYLMQQQFGLVSNGRDAADRIRFDGWESDFRTRDAALKSATAVNPNDRLRPVIVGTEKSADHFGAIIETLARLERTDGLTIPQLIQETQSRIPRDASVIVIVQDIDDAAALALGLLRKQGYAVSAIVNNFEQEPFARAAGRLLANRILVYHLFDSNSIPEICRNMILRY